MSIDKNLLKNVDIGTGELSPGATKPRYEPEGGWKKHKERIHRESNTLDKKNLPFTFSKPTRPKRQTLVRCLNCGNIVYVPVNTVGMVCGCCKKYSGVEVIEND